MPTAAQRLDRQRCAAARRPSPRWARTVSLICSPIGEHRIERAHRLLEDHADPPSPNGPHCGFGQLQQIAPLEPDLPGRAERSHRQQAENGEASDGLAAAALADYPDALARRYGEADVLGDAQASADAQFDCEMAQASSASGDPTSCGSGRME